MRLAGLLLPLIINPPQIRAQDAGRVFALLAIDTDSQIAGIDEDGRSMTAALTSGFGNSGILELSVLAGAEVRPGAIVEYFRTVRSGPNDVLLFYYTGHGGMFEGRGHVLTTSHGNLPRDALRAAMSGRRPRLCVLLSDCCSSVVRRQPQGPAPGAPAPRPEVSPMFRCLLLQHRGLVDVTSSSFGEASWSRPGTGGFFTAALGTALGSWGIDEFDQDKDGFVTWAEVFDQVRRETQATYREFKQDLLSLSPRDLDPKLRASLESQRDQSPQAFALGDPLRGPAHREYFAPNIGIQFRMVDVGGATGARLTRNPALGSGAAQLRLEPGDTIYNLDGLPIREAVDVMNHHGRTDVSFINVRTGRPQAGVMLLPPYTPPPQDMPQENYAANLGIHYQLIPLRGDSFGVRLSRTALGNTPGAAMRLERGDMIVRLDGQPIRSPDDVLSHFDQTSVEFVNIRTGRIETRIVQLPGPIAR
jgi:hypothetical protein